MSNVADNIGYSLEDIFKDSYVVPLYQRGFAWKDAEIEQLLQDVFESYEENKNNPNGKYFIGSLVVLQRHNGTYEVVDGQQRLTTLSLFLLISYLSCRDSHRLGNTLLSLCDIKHMVSESFEVGKHLGIDDACFS